MRMALQAAAAARADDEREPLVDRAADCLGREVTRPPLARSPLPARRRCHRGGGGGAVGRATGARRGFLSLSSFRIASLLMRSSRARERRRAFALARLQSATLSFAPSECLQSEAPPQSGTIRHANFAARQYCAKNGAIQLAARATKRALLARLSSPRAQMKSAIRLKEKCAPLRVYTLQSYCANLAASPSASTIGAARTRGGGMQTKNARC